MNHTSDQDDTNEKLDETIFNGVPVITTSSPSTDSRSDLVVLPIFRDCSKLSTDQHSDNDEFDTSFITNNNQTNRRVSFLRSPTANNLNTSNASRGNVRRWSQSLSNAAKSKQQKAIHFMPSRLQKLPTVLSLDGQLLRIVPGESEIKHFVQEIAQHDYLMEESAAAEQLRITTLRNLPQALSVKRRIKSKITDIVKDKSLRMGINRWKRASYFIGYCSTKTHIFIRNSMRNVRLWYDSMKEIEGYFGAGVETYFRFFRFLFVINFLLMCITFSFIVIPQLLEDNFKATTPILDKTLLKSFESLSGDVNLIDFFTAQGCVENSTMFYGAYTIRKINLFGIGTYSLPYAYLMTMICLYAASIVIFSITTAESYRRSFIDTSGGESLKAHKLFCSWDFAISNQRAADLKRNSIYLELRTILNDFYESEYQPPIWQRTGGYMISVVIWIFIVIILIGIGYSIVYENILDDYETQYSDFLFSPPLFIPIFLVVLMISIQTLFEWLGTLEDYKSPRSQLHIALIRNYLLEITIITSLIVDWLSNTENKKCWEIEIGQKIYRLIIIDFIIVTLIGSALRSTRFLIHRFVWKSFDVSEFNISRGCLGLIFNQTLLWMGLFFSPPLAALIVVKMIATFYIKKIVLINFCKSPSKLWRSSQTFTLFLAMTFVSLTIVIVSLLFVLTQMNVSQTCGPFHNHNYMFDVLRGDILKLQENHFLYQFIILLTRPAAIGCVLLILCVLVYYIRSKSKARIAMVKLLKEMLYIEAKDKEFLLANITRVTQENEWLLDDLTKHQNGVNRYGRQFDKCTDNNFSWQLNKDSSIQSGDSSGDGRKQNSHRSFSSSIGSSVNGIDTLRKRRMSSYE